MGGIVLVKKDLVQDAVEATFRKPPKIGFMPSFNDYGETFPLIEIAKKYMTLGGQAIFIGHKGEYDKLAKDIGCRVIELKRNVPKKLTEKNIKLSNKYHYKNMYLERYYSRFFSKEYEKLFINKIEREIKIFKDEKVRLIVAAFAFTPLISARVANIPLVVLISGVAIPPYFESNYATFPESYENFFTHLIPQSIKNRLTNWYILRCKWGVKGFNRLARKYKTPQINRFLNLFQGDYTFIADNIDFLKLRPSPKFPKKNYIGPILPENPSAHQENLIEPDVKMHLKRQGRSILFTFGSIGVKKIFFKVLNALNKTNHNVIVPYTTVIKENEIPNLNENILLKKFIPSINKINEMVDLAIIHGGRGTIYTAAFSGKPIIGIPMHAEQQWNLNNLVKHGVGVMLSRKNFSESNLFTAINKIFSNYETYLNQARLLKDKLPEPKAAEIAAKQISEIAINHSKNQ